MAKLTWLGEDALHNIVTSEGVTVYGAGPSFTTWQEIKFPKGESIEVTDARIISKAKTNQFFKVEDDEPKRGPGRPPKVKWTEDEIKGLEKKGQPIIQSSGLSDDDQNTE